MKNIFVIGAAGQIGSELTLELRKIYGSNNVIAGDLREKPTDSLMHSGPYEQVDVTEYSSMRKVVERYHVDTIVHMAAILSATGEKNPNLAWDVNINGLYNVLELARKYEMKRVLVPSSIAVFGPGTPHDKTQMIARKKFIQMDLENFLCIPSF